MKISDFQTPLAAPPSDMFEGQSVMVETLIGIAKERVSAYDYTASAALAQILLQIAPTRHEGFRIYIRSRAETETDLLAALSVLDSGAQNMLLTKKMQKTHLLQILKAALSLSDATLAWQSCVRLVTLGETPAAVDRLNAHVAAMGTVSEIETAKTLVAALKKHATTEARAELSDALDRAEAALGERAPLPDPDVDPAPLPPPERRTDAMFHDVIRAPQSLGYWHQAGAALGAADPTDVPALFTEAVSLARQQDFPLAQLGMLFFGVGKAQPYGGHIETPERWLALDMLAVAFSKQPTPEIADRMFNGFLRLEDHESCERILELWEKQFPKDTNILIAKSRLALSRGDLDASARHAIEARKNDPKSPAALARSAIVNRAQGRTGEALHDIARALRARPENTGFKDKYNHIEQELTAVRAFTPQPADEINIYCVTPEAVQEELLRVSKILDQAREKSWLLIAPDARAQALQAELTSRRTLPEGAGYFYGGRPVYEPDPSLSDWVMLSGATLERLRARGADTAQKCLEDLRANFRGCYLAVSDDICGTTAPERLPAECLSEQPGVYSKKLVLTPRAAALVEGDHAVVLPEDAVNLNAQHILAATPDDWPDLRATMEMLSTPLILCIPPGSTEQWGALSDDDLDDVTHWRRYASSIVITDRVDEERLEDRLNIAAPVYDTFAVGLDAAVAFAKDPVCIAVGAGIGNILFTTPLIREISETLGHPVDVIVHSPVDVAVQLFGESRFVNTVCTTDQPRNTVYGRAHVSNCFGERPFGYPARRKFEQRRIYDFTKSTRNTNEADFNFLTVERLFPDVKKPSSLSGRMFIRSYESPPEACQNDIPVIGMSGPRKASEWGLRQWSRFPELVEEYKEASVRLRSFGLPEDKIAGTADCTSRVLRESIRAMRNCDLFITSDGGVFHIADALGLKTIVLFGPTSVRKNGPVNGRTSVLKSEMPCAPCQYTQEFLDCGYAACMAQITCAQVREVAERRLAEGPDVRPFAAPIGAILQSAANTPRNGMGEAQALRRAALSPHDCRLLFEAAVRFRKYDRAERYLEWLNEISGFENTDWLKQCRLALLQRDAMHALKICGTEAQNAPGPRVAIEWIRSELVALLQADDDLAVIQRWESVAPTLTAEHRAARGAYASCLWTYSRALLRVDRWADAHKSILETIACNPNLKAATDALHHFKPGPYNDPDQRAKLKGPAGPKLVVSREVSIKDLLGPYRQSLDIYIEGPEESGPASRFDLSMPDKRLNLFGVPRVAKLRDGVAGRLRSITRFIPGKKNKETPEKRIMVVAHHHLDRWNPRGGERSTLNIVRRLQAEGYSVLVLVENKKTDNIECETLDGVNYVLSGRYALAETIETVIKTWLPDAAILYGHTALRAYKTLVDHSVPYLMFPRDWQEICPKPYSRLLERPSMREAGSEYQDLLGGAAQVITNSRYVGEVIEHLYGLPSINSYVPVEAPMRGNRRDPKGPILLVNPRKMDGGSLVRELAPLMPDREFRVVGEDGLPFPPNVATEPFFNGRYEDLYDQSSVFLFPLIGEDPCGTGRVVFEALHCGVPAIATDLGGMKEVLPKDWLVADNSAAAWRDAIERVLGDAAVAEKCRDSLVGFDADAQFDIIRSSLQHVLAK